MATNLIWSSDLYKGFKLDKNTLLSGNVNDILPFQMLTMEEKTPEWVQAVADYYDIAAWNNVERKAARIERNYQMRYGKLTKSDYIINPTPQEYSRAIGMFVPNEKESPLEQFYSLAPTFVDVLRGEFIKRDNRWTIEAIDPQSVAQAFEYKKEQFEQVVTRIAMMQKQQALANMGITQDANPQQYNQEIQKAMEELTQVELKSKNYRTVGAKWAEKVLDIHEKRYNLDELEPDGFECGLISDAEFWHLDLMDDDFKVELLNPKYCDYHKGPNVKYVSEGDYFAWFDFMSAGDIINKFGRKMKEEDILKLKDIFVRQAANIIVPDYLKSRQGEYYDLSKPWLQATDLNPAMNDSLLGNEFAYNFMRSPNFDHNITTDMFNPVFGRLTTGHPQMFRVMRLYWRSLARVGWLTKINRDGTRETPDWVDENYKVTMEPEYDKSVVKEETKDNLVYGEHIDWTWRPEWRHVIKISANGKHSFWLGMNDPFMSIYIDGAPVKFQFKGRQNPFDGLPPVEGCVFSYINSAAHSFIDRLRPLQIIYNICMNKVPKKFLKDRGLKIAIDKRSFPVNNPNNVVDSEGNKLPTMDPQEAYEDMLDKSDIVPYMVSREAAEGMGQPAVPQVLQLSTAQEAIFYLNAADQIKWMAGETVGITRQRVGAQKASETATGVQQGINYSETQTEKYFEQHSNLMQRVRQRMLDAAQYYSTFKESAREVYMNEMDENVFLEIEGMDNLLPHYNIYLQSKANVRAALQNISKFLMEENTLPIAPSAKLEALVSNSIPKILNVVRRSELEEAQREQAQQAAEQQQQQAQIQHEQEMQAQNLAHQDEQKQLDRESQERIATIRALGGVQTDVNKDLVPDAQQNLDNYLRQQEILQKNRESQREADLKQKNDTDKMIMAREKNMTDLEREKIKAEAAKEVAKTNKNKYDK